LNPYAVEAMKKNGVDISSHHAKLLQDLDHVHFDLVITVCDHADANCPVFPGNTTRIHQGFDDPPKLAEQYPDAEDKMMQYLKVCKEIKEYVELFFRI